MMHLIFKNWIKKLKFRSKYFGIINYEVGENAKLYTILNPHTGKTVHPLEVFGNFGVTMEHCSYFLLSDGYILYVDSNVEGPQDGKTITPPKQAVTNTECHWIYTFKREKAEAKE